MSVQASRLARSSATRDKQRSLEGPCRADVERRRTSAHMEDAHVTRSTEGCANAPTRAEPRPRRWDFGCSLTCFLTTLHPEKALARALIQHLSHEMPDINFTLEDRSDVDAVWVCGYEPGARDFVRGIRAAHPESELLVTGRPPLEIWQDEARSAGADHTCAWPTPSYAAISRLLHARRRGSPRSV